MKNKLTICVLICLMTLLVGCNSNTAKEAAQEKTKTETSFPAGNSEKQTQETTKEETEHIPVQESTPSANSKAEVSNPAQSKADESAAIPETEKPKNESSKQTEKPAVSNTQSKPSNEETISAPPKEEKPANETTDPKPDVLPEQSFDVSRYVSYATEYALSIGLSLDSTATECWDNPISANQNRTGIESDIESRLNRYKNAEGFTAVWIWTEKLSETEYNIYIGYC